jgi:endonuclease/exonuclease/phosphatase (EEP) superfamily protein YafD
LLELVRSEKPDVIILEEINQDWVDSLSELRETYPPHLEHPEEDNFGNAIVDKT